MDAQIYQFKRSAPDVWPEGELFSAALLGAMRFSACYFSAMIAFHAMMIRCAMAPLKEVARG